MRVAKRSFIVTGLLAIFSLALFYAPFLTAINRATDIMLAIFGGAFLACIVALIEYFVARELAMEDFVQRSEDVLHSFRQVKYFHGDPSDILGCAQSYRLISDREIRDLGNAYARLDFLFANKSLKLNAYEKIYQPLHGAYLVAAEKSWHFENDFNRAVWSSDLTDLNAAFFEAHGLSKWGSVDKALDDFTEKINQKSRQRG